MKYVFQFLRILAFCFLGEALRILLPLPVPASIYGLVLLLAALRAGLVRLDQVREAAGFLIAIFPLLFVPSAAGIMELGPVLLRNGLPVLLAVVTQAVSRRKEARHE